MFVNFNILTLPLWFRSFFYENPCSLSYKLTVYAYTIHDIVINVLALQDYDVEIHAMYDDTQQLCATFPI